MNRPLGREQGPPSPGDGLDLAGAVTLALRVLSDLRRPPEAVRDGRLEHLLRASLVVPATSTAPHDGDGDDAATAAGRVAAMTACAHLAAAAYEDAYLALRTAHDVLDRPGGDREIDPA